jgi:acyl-CoA synthetase (AMP-forming)/AMP-acid ligase II
MSVTMAPSSNFGDLFWRPVKLYPGKTAIHQGSHNLTYAQLEQRTRQAARLLHEQGIGHGDKVLMLMTNDFRFVECLFGILRTGAVAVPLNIKLGSDALIYVSQHSDARLLIAHADLLDKAQAIRAEAKNITSALLIGGSAQGFQQYDDLLVQTHADFETVQVEPAEIAMMMYTSGSTGRPKGCLLSHANKWWTAQNSVLSMMHVESDRALIVGPLYHANALWGSLLPMLYIGGSAVILPGFAPVPVIETINRYKPTFMSGTPSMYSLILLEREALAQHDVTSIEVLMCGSAPVPEELMNTMRRTFDCEVVETYGLTEAGANVLTPRWGIKKLGSCGLPVMDVQVRIVALDDSARLCAVGEVGELWCKGPANIIGYYKQPEVTAQKITPDGWLKTGDLMSADEQGYIYFRGRVDDMINVGGENVYPKEVETILLEHPAVADVCVVAVPHQVKGSAPVAWIVLHRGETLTEQELKQFFLERGSAYAHPRRVFLIDVLPVSGTNKIDRKWLTEEAARQIPGGILSGQG